MKKMILPARPAYRSGKHQARLFVAISFLCFLSIISVAQAPDWQWARTSYGAGSINTGNSIATDASGNVYVTGDFFPPSITFGSYTLINSHAGGEIFLVKYNASGDVIWAKNAVSTGAEGRSVATDVFGNVYLAGTFGSNTLAFDSFIVTNTNNININPSDIFLAKFDSLGNVIWLKNAGAHYNVYSVCIDNQGNSHLLAGRSYAYSICTDNQGNVLITGTFGSTIVFDSYTLVNSDSCNEDIFLAKYNSSGSVLWAKSATRINIGYDQGAYFESTKVSIDASGNTYITGYLHSPSVVVFGSDTLSSVGANDIFLAKYDASGNVLWAKSAGGTNSDGSTSLALDASGNVYITGCFASSILVFGSDTLSATSGVPNSDVFLAKYDSSGNVIWAKSAIGQQQDHCSSMTIDALENVYLTGDYGCVLGTSTGVATITFDQITLPVLSQTYNPMFIVKYNSNGNVLWASALERGGDYGNDVTADSFGNIFIGGSYSSLLSLGPFILGLDSLNGTASFEEVFVAKFHNVITGITEMNNSLGISVFPNPTANNITIIIPGLEGRQAQKATIEILNIEGQIIKSITTNENHTSIDISSFAKGMYFVKVKLENGITVKKFIKQ